MLSGSDNQRHFSRQHHLRYWMQSNGTPADANPDFLLLYAAIHPPMNRRLRPDTTVFLTILFITILVWVLRGVGILTFLPGIVIWVLLILSVGTGVFSGIQGTRR
jgi:hypothetical protein